MTELMHYGVKGMQWDQHKMAQPPPAYIPVQKTAPALIPVKKPVKKVKVTANDHKLVEDVLAGKYGNGDARKKALGPKYNLIQDMVNKKVLGAKYKPRFNTGEAGSKKTAGKKSHHNKAADAARKKQRAANKAKKKADRLKKTQERAKSTAARKALANQKKIAAGKARAERLKAVAAKRAAAKKVSDAKKAERAKATATRLAAASARKTLSEAKAATAAKKRQNESLNIMKHAMEGTMDHNQADFLMHHGIKGQKWGVRRTRAQLVGRATDFKKSASLLKEDLTGKTTRPVRVTAVPGHKVKTAGGQRHPAHPEAITIAELKQKAKTSTTDSLSNQELQAVINRVNMEKQYKQVVGESMSTKGKKFVRRMFGTEAVNRYGKNIPEPYKTALITQIRKG